MRIDTDLLQRFEAGLDPQRLSDSRVPGKIVGYGEISAIFQIQDDDDNVYKRLPVFGNHAAAQRYAAMHADYCGRLQQAGLRLPAFATQVVALPRRPVVLYIAQQRLAGERFGHRLIHRLDDGACLDLIEAVAGEIEKVWTFNRTAAPSVTLAIDGQLSNWVAGASRGQGWQLFYIDTSTPLMRNDGIEQLDPELLLKSAPDTLRWIIRLLFLEEVMNRYYDPRQVYMDLAANLFKEQRPELVPGTVAIVNRRLKGALAPLLTVEEIDAYYARDKWIWTIFLAFRRFDRWIKTRLMSRRYEFILPGKIQR